MSANLNSRLKKTVARLTSSIAFYPAIIAVLFLAAFWGMITIDDSITGKHIKASWQWLRMKDATTARLIASTIAGGMLSFTVFSFSMVMIVLNQTASKMSNRILETIIRNRFQQIVLGCYIGTVMYSLFLITTIRDIDNGIYVPALSTYLLILFAIVDIFLFIYFLHFVTQYAKYQTIINHIHLQTLHQLQKEEESKQIVSAVTYNYQKLVPATKTGYFEGCDEGAFLSLKVESSYHIKALYPLGSFLLHGTPLLQIESNEPISKEQLMQLGEAIEIENQPSFTYFLSGFGQLSEVAMKALSPGINDPATAVLSLQALSHLFCWLFVHPLPSSVVSENKKRTMTYHIPGITELLSANLLAVWDYGQDDRTIQIVMIDLVRQLQPLSRDKVVSEWLAQFLNTIQAKATQKFHPLK